MDFLVLPSYREGFLTVVLEAAAMGKPAIVTDATGCIDSVKHQKTGIIVPVKSSSALARALRTYLTNILGKCMVKLLVNVLAMFDKRKYARLIQNMTILSQSCHRTILYQRRFFRVSSKIHLRLCDVISYSSSIDLSASRSYRKWPFFDKEQKNAVNRVLRSGRVNY